jgi:hypothetical protein
VPSLFFWGTPKLLLIIVIQIDISTACKNSLLSVSSLAIACLFENSHANTMRWYLSVVLICVSPIIAWYTDYLICHLKNSSWEKSLFTFFVHFEIRVFGFLLENWVSFSCPLVINPLPRTASKYFLLIHRLPFNFVVYFTLFIKLFSLMQSYWFTSALVA